ncbi:MAG: hypothetical protein ACI9VX_000291, partial [Dinoroseobacter sp.]
HNPALHCRTCSAFGVKYTKILTGVSIVAIKSVFCKRWGPTQS